MSTRQNGAEIRRRRKEAGYGLTELARLIRITPGGLSNIEADNSNASDVVLHRLAAALHVEYGDLLATPAVVGRVA